MRSARCADAARAHFSGPDEAPFMECDYRPLDVDAVPIRDAVGCCDVRLHVVDEDGPRRFRSVLDAFGAATGIPCLVNTSFNGFHEPIVCTPRDAVRVFFGSGFDVADPRSVCSDEVGGVHGLSVHDESI